MLIEELPINEKVPFLFRIAIWIESVLSLEHADAFESPPLSVLPKVLIFLFVRELLSMSLQSARASDKSWRLSEEEILDLQLKWLGMSTYRTKQIEERDWRACLIFLRDTLPWLASIASHDPFHGHNQVNDRFP